MSKKKTPASPPPLTPEQQTHAREKNEALQARLEPDDWDEVMRQILKSCGTGAIADGAVLSCKKVRRTNCAGPTPKAGDRMSQATADAINAEAGTDIDFDELAQYEGGQATEGYVPWWPQGVETREGVIQVSTARVDGKKDGPLRGASASGVTIGTGVDLGQQDPTVYADRLKKAGIPQALIDKLKPYMKLKRAEACKYLRENPLRITKEEADLIDKEMKSEKLEAAKRGYEINIESLENPKNFEILSKEEQTILFSRTYQDGNISKRNNPSIELSKYLAQGDYHKATSQLSTEYYRSISHKDRIPKEHDYLNKFYSKQNRK